MPVLERLAARMNGQPTPHRLTLMEIWRPLRYIGSRGPRCFWRECFPLGTSAAGRPIWGPPSPWRTMDREFARDVLAAANPYFTLDSVPGVTFCVRKFNAPVLADWGAARELRSLAAGSPEAPQP